MSKCIVVYRPLIAPDRHEQVGDTLYVYTTDWKMFDREHRADFIKWLGFVPAEITFGAVTGKMALAGNSNYGIVVKPTEEQANMHVPSTYGLCDQVANVYMEEHDMTGFARFF